MNNVAPLVLTLININRQATDEELQQIITHAAQAPFSARPLKMNRWLRQELADRGFRVPSHIQHVPNAEAYIFVAYSADHGVIKTGFQASSPEAIFTEAFEHLRRHR